MAYCFVTTLKDDFEQVVIRVTDELVREGFGILTEIDVKATLKKKLGVDFRPYRILGACNPPYALRALQAEPRIGAMLPCNVIVQQLESGEVEVAAVDPLASMQAIENQALGEVAGEIRMKLQKVITRLG